MSKGVYTIYTGQRGWAIFLGGLFVQAAIIAELAGLSEVSQQPLGIGVAAFFICAAVYFVIDVAWVFCIEMTILNWMFDEAGYERPKLTRMLLLPTFFVYASLANTLVVILPALDEGMNGINNFWTVGLRAFCLGWFSYGNLALVQAWSYKRYPLEIVGIMPLSGGLLSFSSSLITYGICKQAFYT